MAATTRRGSAKNPTSGNDTPNTPQVKESELAALKVDELRQRLRDRGVTGTSGLRKAELVKRLAKEYRADAKGGRGAGESKKAVGAKATGTRSEAKKSVGRGTAKKAGSTVRTGKNTSKSIKYAQEISSPEQEPERPGRSLVTTDHDVIRQWAEERGATPATVGDTGPGDTLGVLRFDFPGYGGGDLREVGWDEWFDTFDRRGLNFIYQEETTDGRQSNFFRLENPDREDA
jgi:hypothetical protein